MPKSKMCPICDLDHERAEFLFSVPVSCVRGVVLELRAKNKALRAQLKALSKQQVLPFSGDTTPVKGKGKT